MNYTLIIQWKLSELMGWALALPHGISQSTAKPSCGSALSDALREMNIHFLGSRAAEPELSRGSVWAGWGNPLGFALPLP